jgi:hypothetical protein
MRGGGIVLQACDGFISFKELAAIIFPVSNKHAVILMRSNLPL